MNSAAFKRGLHDGVPIGLGYFAVSFTFGMMAAAGGISAGAAVLISLTNLTSAGQFAGIEIIFAAGSLWEMADTACDQSEILSDVFFTFPEAGTGYFHGAQASGCFWSYG